MLTRTKPMGRGSTGLQRTVFKTRAVGTSESPARQVIEQSGHRHEDGCKDREQRLAARAQRAMTSALFTTDMLGQQKAAIASMPQTQVVEWVTLPMAAPTTIPKEELLRSERYRRLVAALPCACCQIQDRSQHAHENVGKGMGLKVDDRRGFPLCTVAPGRVGCHELFDQYVLVEGGREAHRLLGEHWAAETRKKIIEAGLWPKKLPLWKGDEDGSKQG